MYKLANFKTLALAALAFSIASCNDDDDAPVNLRSSIDYNTLTPTTAYSKTFVDASGATTVDFSEGATRLKMFQALNYYGTSNIAANTHIDAAQFKKLYSNTGNPFTDISTATINVKGAELNSASVQLKDATAASWSATEANKVRSKVESLFDQIDVVSNSLSQTASAGKAGKIGSYLVDEKGIEVLQVIQKSLIGAIQLDYINNVLLDKGLQVDNTTPHAGVNYTELEHNWDIAYGMLTLNPIFLEGSTDATRATVEFGLGSYVWEYNKGAYAKIYPAYLKGRAAIVNNDRTEIQAQATFIRTELEKAVATSAFNYLEKWRTGQNDQERVHAIGEAIGFIYALRFATIAKADAAFSDNIITGLTGSANGFWDIDIVKINTAKDAIKAKFNL